MQDCHYFGCSRPATHWVVRYVREGWLPNPDARAYCDSHRFPTAAAAAAALRAPVERVEVVEIADVA